jgi:DNA-binding transcriptional LysR family regulator
MELSQLRSMVAVARHQGFTGAADALGLAKSAVSNHIRLLEQSLGVRLFVRSSRRVSLTSEGELVLRRAQSVLAELDHLREDALQGHTQVRGDVRISASPEFGTMLAAALVPRLTVRLPEVRLALHLSYDPADIQNPRHDFAVRLGQVADIQLVARKLGSFQRRVVCSPRLAHRLALSDPRDLSSHPALIFSDHAFDDRWVLANQADTSSVLTLDVSGQIAVQGFRALQELAERGEGHAFLPDFMVASALAQGRLVEPFQGWRSRPINAHLVYRPGAGRIGRVQAVMEEVLAISREWLVQESSS